LKTLRNPSINGRLATLLILFAITLICHSAEPDGVIVTLEKYDGPAVVSVKSLERFKIKISIDRKTDRKALTLAVQLPKTGKNTWPANDVEAIDSSGKAVIVKRGGIAWSMMWIPVPAGQSEIVVHALDPPEGTPKNHPEKERHIKDPLTGLSAKIALWPKGKKAALSLRFDDSHPTHLSKAIPILREYGFKGTFMINPDGKNGPPKNSRWRSAFKEHLTEWQAVAKRRDQEFGNHTARHSGAKNDAEMENEISDACEAIWQLFPAKSKLLALNLGGGTYWETSKTLRHYLDKYHLFDASSGSMGMDDVYGNRVESFRKHVEGHLKSGAWCRAHFHYIGDNLSTSEEHFRAALDIAKKHQDDLWITGMSDIYKYQAERRAATLTLVKSQKDSVTLKLYCPTNPELFDQLLTIEIILPEAWMTSSSGAHVTDADENLIATGLPSKDGSRLLRFPVLPVNSQFIISKFVMKVAF